MSAWVPAPWPEAGGAFMAVVVEVSEHEEFSALLGPDGRPLRYERFRVGFDTRPAPARHSIAGGGQR